MTPDHGVDRLVPVVREASAHRPSRQGRCMPTALGIMKPCSRTPRPSAMAPRIIASVRPTSWMIGCPRKPAGRRQQAEQDRRRAGNARGTGPTGPSPSGRDGEVGDRSCAMRERYRRQQREVTIYHRETFRTLPSGSPQANRRSPHGLCTRLCRPAARLRLERGRAPCRTCCLLVAGAGLRDGRRRRHHPPDRKRPVDHRVEADQRRDPAAHARRLGARLRALQADARNISEVAGPGRNDPRRLQVHLLLGVGRIGCSAASSASSSSSRVAWFAREARDPHGLRLAAGRRCSSSAGFRARVGWFMVMSGLEGRTEVSPYRLSAHLLFALVPVRRASSGPRSTCGNWPRSANHGPPRLTGWRRDRAWPSCSSSCCSVPGSPASAPATSRNDWPDMEGRFVPEGIDWSPAAAVRRSPTIPYLLHFLHRWWAWVVVAVLVLFARKVRRIEGARPRLDRNPLGVRDADPAWHPHRPFGHRDLARGASPGDRARCSSRRPSGARMCLGRAGA